MQIRRWLENCCNDTTWRPGWKHRCDGRLLSVARGFQSATGAIAVNNRLFFLSGPVRSDSAERLSLEPMNYERWFLSELPAIEQVIAHVCRRNRLRDDEAEEFASEVKLHFVENDYEVLRRFQQRSSLRTYLTVVIHRQFLNYRNRLWGRWRPSAEALRIGAVATLLERLTTRDGCGFEEAAEQMRTNYGVEDSRDALYELWTRLSRGAAPRRFVTEEHAAEVPSPGPDPETSVVRAEREFLNKRTRVALERAKQDLSADERLLIKMHIDDGFKISEIARALHLDQKKLYRTFERLFVRLRERIEAEGVSAEDIREGTLG